MYKIVALALLAASAFAQTMIYNTTGGYVAGGSICKFPMNITINKVVNTFTECIPFATFKPANKKNNAGKVIKPTKPALGTDTTTWCYAGAQ